MKASSVDAKIQRVIDWAEQHYFTCAAKVSPAYKAGLIKSDYLPGLYRLTSIVKNDRKNIFKAIQNFGYQAIPENCQNRAEYLCLLDSFIKLLIKSDRLQNELTLETSKGVIQALIRLASGDIEDTNVRPWQKCMSQQFKLANEIIDELNFNTLPFEQKMAYCLFANFADHASFSEGEQVRKKLQNINKLSNWYEEYWSSFQMLLDQYYLISQFWNELLSRWNNACHIVFVTDNAFEWAFDLHLIEEKVTSNLKLGGNNWDIIIVPRRFMIGDDLDAAFVEETIYSSNNQNNCKQTLNKNLFISAASSIQGFNWIEADEYLVNSLAEQDLFILKGYGNFLCSAPNEISVDRFHFFVPKGMAGRRITGKFYFWNNNDICPPLVLYINGVQQIGAGYPRIKNTIYDFITGNITTN